VESCTAKKHNHRFIEPVRSSESGLPLVSLLNPNVVISPPDIEFRKVTRMFENVDKIGDMRKRVSVLECVRIYIAIILAGTEHSILLWDKKEGGRLWRL